MKSKNSKSKGIRDYFGNPIEPGDVVLRSRHSYFQRKNVVKITECYLHTERDKTDYFPNLPVPLKIALYRDKIYQPHLINLTKLNLD